MFIEPDPLPAFRVIALGPLRKVVGFLRSSVLTDHRVETGSELTEVVAVRPPALDEFKLIADVALETHENEPFVSLILGIRDPPPSDTARLFAC